MNYITPYNPDWAKRFATLAALLRENLPEDCTVHHVGSTAVPGLCAKDIIDVDILCRPGRLRYVLEALDRLGYAHLGDRGIEGREAFEPRENSTVADLPAHHLYALEAGAFEFRKHQAFVTYLCAMPSRRDWLAGQKQQSDAQATTRAGYIEAKDRAYRQIVAEALAWRDAREGRALGVRQYRSKGPEVIVLHGGPGAGGSARPIAQGLADAFAVCEPMQRGSGEGALSVARHVEDLRTMIGHYCASRAPALVGESWGAMLALAYAAAYPEQAGPVVLVGCGTFSQDDRDVLQATLAGRTTPAMRQELDRIAADVADPLERMRAQYRVVQPLYDVDPLEDPHDVLAGFDAAAHRETWDDMLRCQAEGVYPQAFEAVRSPVLMVHGQADPHPGPATYRTLREYIPQLEYVELAACGHSPWRERRARQVFFETLHDWLAAKLA